MQHSCVPLSYLLQYTKCHVSVNLCTSWYKTNTNYSSQQMIRKVNPLLIKDNHLFMDMDIMQVCLTDGSSPGARVATLVCLSLFPSPMKLDFRWTLHDMVQSVMMINHICCPYLHDYLMHLSINSCMYLYVLYNKRVSDMLVPDFCSYSVT